MESPQQVGLVHIDKTVLVQVRKRINVGRDLFHLTDLTMDEPRYAAMLGYTPREIERFYPRRLDAFAKKLKTDRKGALKRLLDWYDSYWFCPDSRARVCNPISIAKALRLARIDSYWVKTAVSSLVMERIAAAGKSPADFEGCTATRDELDLCDALTLPAKSLMYQSGYLTIKGLSKTEFDALVNVAKRQVVEGNVDGLINETLYRVYAKIPPEWKIRSEADVKRHFRRSCRAEPDIFQLSACFSALQCGIIVTA